MVVATGVHWTFPRSLFDRTARSLLRRHLTHSPVYLSSTDRRGVCWCNLRFLLRPRLMVSEMWSAFRPLWAHRWSIQMDRYTKSMKCARFLTLPQPFPAYFG